MCLCFYVSVVDWSLFLSLIFRDQFLNSVIVNHICNQPRVMNRVTVLLKAKYRKKVLIIKHHGTFIKGYRKCALCEKAHFCFSIFSAISALDKP